jgi:hypothetical protein
MENTQNTELIAQLQERANAYERILDTQILEHCNCIVQVGAMTLTTNERREVVPQLTAYPTQFSEESVTVIMGITFYNGQDEVVKAEVFKVKDWYSKRLIQLNEAIEILKIENRK